MFGRVAMSIGAAMVCFAFAGCETTPPLTPTQWEAIETRQVEGKRDDVLRAASAVILDQGYFYTASDQAAGTVTAARVPSSMQEEFQRNGGMTGPAMVDTISIWVLQTSPTQCNLRVQYRDFGRHVESAERVSAFWTEVQRRMLKPEPRSAVGG
ncbi:MAG: hypothetical protein ACREJD_05490 [Phycisphaerales bacterium]